MTDLNAECEKAWAAYRIAHNQAMSNGAALQEAQAEVQSLSARVAELEGVLRSIADEYAEGMLSPDAVSMAFKARDALTKEGVVG